MINIKYLFYLLYAALFLCFGLAWKAYVNPDLSYAIYYELGEQFGYAAIIVYVVTLTPGIAQRLSVSFPLKSLIVRYRRQLGILMFLLALGHYLIVRAFSLFTGKVSLPLPVFETMGFFALLTLLALFVTSNDYSVRLLGRFWKKLQRVSYLAMLFIFAHVALQEISVWTVIMAVFVLLQVASWVRYYRS